jgi:hypothetical protein
MMNLIVRRAPIKKIANVMAAGIYSDLSSGKYKNNDRTDGRNIFLSLSKRNGSKK